MSVALANFAPAASSLQPRALGEVIRSDVFNVIRSIEDIALPRFYDGQIDIDAVIEVGSHCALRLFAIAETPVRDSGAASLHPMAIGDEARATIFDVAASMQAALVPPAGDAIAKHAAARTIIAEIGRLHQLSASQTWAHLWERFRSAR